MRFGLEEDLLEEILKIIRNHKCVKKVILYGSRARGDYRKTSDIDLAIEGCPDWEVSEIRETLEEEAPTLLTFDVVNLEKAPKELKENILKEGVVIYEKPTPRV